MKRFLAKTLIIMLVAMSVCLTVNAAQIEIIPNSTRITNVTISTSFQTCRDLDSLNSTLGTTSLDPHLATNEDFGAVSYLANSIYGLNASYDEGNQGKVGKTVSIDGNSFYSTTPNITGVMNWGGTPSTTIYTQTAGLLSAVTTLGDEATIESTLSSLTSSNYSGADTFKNIKVLVKNKDNRYVESLANAASTMGMAMGETSGWGKWNYFGSDKVFPVSIRNGLFGFGVGSPASGTTSGGARSDVTFRPVIWNI